MILILICLLPVLALLIFSVLLISMFRKGRQGTSPDYKIRMTIAMVCMLILIIIVVTVSIPILKFALGGKIGG